ncbi:hypothetical protein RI129_001863 [Pyrocoelia pectoralis]|uniref:Tyr recombinase domain-containing protein n=1 Tax=Pyrocoelia pectoralis TaxID=417401 RepID=A0AAN7VWJ8_9COLE
MGLVGACRSTELRQMKISDIKDLGSAFLVKVPNAKTKTTRTFTITDKFYELCKKYINVRPKNPSCPTTFFLNYKQGKCTTQIIGINQFGSMGKKIAHFLNLPHPELYTGHTLRRSSATLHVNCGGEITTLKRHGRWKSTSVAEGCIDDSITNKMDTADNVFKTVNVNASTTSSTYVHKNTQNETVNLDINSTPTLHFTNCSNITINFYKENDH